MIRFTLPNQVNVALTIYNLSGQKVTTVVEGMHQAGVHTVTWDGRDREGRALASGVYVMRLQAGEQEQTRKLVLLR